MRQKVLNNGNKIFNSILEEISNANEEILVAQTWFTDEILLDKLIEKAKQGLTVKLILGDKKDNNKLDFNQLSKLPSVKIKRIRGKSYGGVNSKYCIIDKNIAISGSYNWSLNAKTNSEENVIITEHQPTVQKLYKQFFKTFNKKEGLIKTMLRWFKKEVKKVDANTEIEDVENNFPVQSSQIEQNVLRSDEVLDSIVTSEIENFDRKVLEDRGYETAQKVGGNPLVLNRVMDSLYNLFIAAINNLEEKKLNLKTKIDLFVEEQIHNFSELYNGKISASEIEKTAKEKQYKSDEIVCESKIAEYKLEIEQLETQKIPQKEKEIKELENEKLNIDKENIIPLEKKWYHMIPYIIIPLSLLIAVFLFYSSSAYILLYAIEDYELYEKPTKIFNAKAYWLAKDRGGTSLVYIIFFTVIPFALSLIPNYIKQKGWKLFSWIAIIILDSLIALQIKEITGEIFYLETGIKNIINLKWILELIIIFFLGFIPLWAFVIYLNRLKNYLSDQILTEEQEQIIISKTQLTNQILFLDGELYALEEEKNTLERRILEEQETKKQINNELLFLPAEYEKIKNNIIAEKGEKIQYIKTRAEAYKNGIDNNTIYIPIPALRDRINIFLQGWDSWLHDEMANKRAVEFSSAAKEVTDNWVTHNMDRLVSSNSKVIDLK